jgi:REP element-mobilizing transposase RayT
LCADFKASRSVGDLAGTVGIVPRLPRNAFDGYRMFHVTTVGAGESKIFLDDVDRLAFCDSFWEAVLQFELDCIVCCQVGTHYHALLEGRREALSSAMRDLNGAYARRFNVRHGRRGHLFGARFSSWVVESEAHVAAVIPYILWNPVRAGLCRSPAEWSWSWLQPARSQTFGPDIARATGSACPMGQALGRVRERQRRARLRRRGGGGEA